MILLNNILIPYYDHLSYEFFITIFKSIINYNTKQF